MLKTEKENEEYFINLESRIDWDKWVKFSECIVFLILKLRRIVDEIIHYRIDTNSAIYLVSFF